MAHCTATPMATSSGTQQGVIGLLRSYVLFPWVFLHSRNSKEKKEQALPQYYSLKTESVSPRAELNDSLLRPEEYPDQMRMLDKETITPQTNCRVNKHKMGPLPSLKRGRRICL